MLFKSEITRIVKQQRNYRLPNQKIKTHRDLTGVAEGEADEARIDGIPTDDREQSGEQDDDVAQHLKANGQPSGIDKSGSFNVCRQHLQRTAIEHNNKFQKIGQCPSTVLRVSNVNNKKVYFAGILRLGSR